MITSTCSRRTRTTRPPTLRFVTHAMVTTQPLVSGATKTMKSLRSSGRRNSGSFVLPMMMWFRPVPRKGVYVKVCTTRVSYSESGTRSSFISTPSSTPSFANSAVSVSPTPSPLIDDKKWKTTGQSRDGGAGGWFVLSADEISSADGISSAPGERKIKRCSQYEGTRQ